MASTITNSLKKILSDELVDSSENFYIALSRPDAFIVPADVDLSSQRFQMETRHGLIAVKVVSGVSHVIDYNPWSSGTVYNAYNNDSDAQQNFYVMNSNREVFLCVEQAKTVGTGTPSTSLTEPTAVAAGFRPRTFATGDGYKWRYLYKASNLAYSTFKTNSFIPVKKIINRATLVTEETGQILLQDSSVAGEILGLKIDSAGTGYTSAPTITIDGNGTGGSFTAEINNGKIIAVRVDSDFDNGGFNHGLGYEYAKIELSSGDAVLRPIFAPYAGTAADPVITLKSKSVMFQTQFEEDEAGTILTNDNNFYQVALMRNLKKYGSDSDFTGNSGNALKILQLDNASITDRTGFAGIVEKTDETVSANFVAFDSDAGNLLYYYQDETTGFGTFDVGETIQSNGETASIVALIDPDLNAYSGDILYINNLNNPIDRSTGQIEDVRIVIQLTDCN